jgi:hypothetical protein
MQGRALTTPKTSRPPDRFDLVHLVGFGDGRKAHDLPRLLHEDMADKVVFVQPLHDDDNRAPALVVEPAVERVVIPLVASLPLSLGVPFLGLQRIIDQVDVGAAPGQVDR